MADDEQFSLCWNNFNTNLSAGFHDSLCRGDLVDVTLAAEGQFIQAHRLVLSVCSPYFRKMFTQMPTNQHAFVFLKDVSHSALKDLIQFMYCGEVNVKQDALPAFISTAEALQIKGLTDGDPAPSQSPAKPSTPAPQQIATQQPQQTLATSIPRTKTTNRRPQSQGQQYKLDADDSDVEKTTQIVIQTSTAPVAVATSTPQTIQVQVHQPQQKPQVQQQVQQTQAHQTQTVQIQQQTVVAGQKRVAGKTITPHTVKRTKLIQQQQQTNDPLESAEQTQITVQTVTDSKNTNEAEFIDLPIELPTKSEPEYPEETGDVETVEQEATYVEDDSYGDMKYDESYFTENDETGANASATGTGVQATTSAVKQQQASFSESYVSDAGDQSATEAQGSKNIQKLNENLGFTKSFVLIQSNSSTNNTIQSKENKKLYEDDLKEKSILGSNITQCQQTVSTGTLQKIPTDTQQKILTEMKRRISKDTQLKISSDTQGKISPDTQLKIPTDSQQKILTDMKQYIAANIQQKSSTDMQSKISTDTQLQNTSDSQQKILSETRNSTETQWKMPTDTHLEILTDTQQKIATDMQQKISTDMQQKISTDIQLKIPTDSQQKFVTDVKQKITANIQQKIPTNTQQISTDDIQCEKNSTLANNQLSIRNVKRPIIPQIHVSRILEQFTKETLLQQNRQIKTLPQTGHVNVDSGSVKQLQINRTGETPGAVQSKDLKLSPQKKSPMRVQTMQSTLTVQSVPPAKLSVTLPFQSSIQSSSVSSPRANDPLIKLDVGKSSMVPQTSKIEHVVHNDLIPLHIGSKLHISKAAITSIFTPNVRNYSARLVNYLLKSDGHVICEVENIRSIITHVTQVFNRRGNPVTEGAVEKIVMTKLQKFMGLKKK